MVLQAGQKLLAGVVLIQNAVTACILLNGHDTLVLCLMNSSYFVSSLSRRSLFMVWVITVGSL